MPDSTEHAAADTESRGTILIAEDDDPMMMMYQRIFAREGYNLLLAADGSTALELYDKYQDSIDLVISDEELDGARGTEIARTIRNQYDERVPIIVITGCDAPDRAIQVFEAGGNDYLVKPPSFPELVAKVTNLVRMRRAERRLVQANRTMAQDLSAAASYQTGLLPESGLQLGNVASAWIYVPCHFVAGDILNIFRLDNSHVAFYVADVCGHGVSAAMLSTFIYTRLMNESGRSNAVKRLHGDGKGYELAAPNEVCRELDRLLAATKTGMYATLFYAVYNEKTRTLDYCRAGHPAPMLLTSDGEERELLETGGPPVGMDIGLPFKCGRVEVEPGDRLFMYSDGLIELSDMETGEIGGEALLRESVREACGRRLEESLDFTMEKMLAKYEAGQDDLTLFGVEF